MKSSISLMYFPFTVLFVDDNPDALSLYKDEFGSQYNSKFMESSENALALLKEQILSEDYLFNNLSNHIEVNLADHTHEFPRANLTFENLIEIANNKEKYSKIGVIIVDYQMPNLNGIQLCEAVKDQPLKKILLTGQFEVSGAVAAFNNKQIDCYIRKGEKNTITDIKCFIGELIEQYFYDLTRAITSPIIMDKLAFLNDTKYIGFFDSLIDEYNINEYYLIDQNGSFLLVDNRGERFVLVRHNDASLNEFCEFFENEDKVKPLIDAVCKREKLPFFGINANPINIDLTEWDNHFYPASAYSDFYWSIVQI